MKMNSTKLVGLMLLVILFLLDLGCSSFRVTNGATDIRGNIASISRADVESRGKGIIGSLLIEGTIEKEPSLTRHRLQ